ncbi:MAG TPA: hypothetical protein VD731_01095 [Nitrosopumilaceae archaeon]|nr:hypothetical protein [Nitrosopumilaceae archaeon]
MNSSNSKISIIVILSSIFIVSIIFFSHTHSKYAFGFEENLLVFQSGIISTDNKDYAISNDFKIRVIQDGKIIRLSGITTTGEVYYLYQKMKDDKIIVSGKILENDDFIPISYNEEIYKPKIPVDSKTELILSTKLPQHTYASYPVGISVKVFDAKKNPDARFEQSEGALENVLVNVTITNQEGKFVTLLSGKTDSTGLFRENHVVRANIDTPGKYFVNVTANYQDISINQSYTTFFRGSIQDYFGDNP